MKTRVQGSDEVGYLPTAPLDPSLLNALANDIAPLRPSRPDAYAVMAQTGCSIVQVATSVGTPPELLLELAGIKTAIRTWYEKQPDEVIREASAYSARLTEVWTELRLLESHDRQYTQMRTMQVTPVLEEVDRQYKFAQSRIAMQRQDIDLLSKGA